MQKMKYDLYNKIMKDSTLSRNELHFLFWLAAHQDTKGLVTGVYYSDMAKELNISVSGFYFIRDNLEQKGYISWDKSYQADMDIKLYDNSFFNEAGEVIYEQYVDLNIAMFTNPAFFECKAGAIRTGMYFIKRVEAAGAVTMANDAVYLGEEAEKSRKLWFNPFNLFEVLKRILNVEIRSIKTYLEELKEWIGFADIQKEGSLHQVITVLKEGLLRPIKKQKKEYSERQSYIQKVKMYCRRKKIQVEETDQNLLDTADLIRQYKNIASKAECNIITLLCSAIDRTCQDTVNSYNIHKALRDLINYHAPGLLTVE